MKYQSRTWWCEFWEEGRLYWEDGSYPQLTWTDSWLSFLRPYTLNFFLKFLWDFGKRGGVSWRWASNWLGFQKGKFFKENNVIDSDSRADRAEDYTGRGLVEEDALFQSAVWCSCSWHAIWKLEYKKNPIFYWTPSCAKANHRPCFKCECNYL